MKVRINKYLSNIGYCSRREADRLINERRVKINDRYADLGSIIDDSEDEISIDGNLVNRTNEKIYLKFYKPIGVECTTDINNPYNIISYINYNRRIYPIGRLDKNSEGLILLTNDGNIVNPILKSSNNKEKEYIVRVNKPIDDKTIRLMEKGVPILDQITKPCVIKRLGNDLFNITITQGLNRQIRRMCEYFDLTVVKLKRIRIINIELGNMKKGELIPLSFNEINELKKIIGYNDE